jgi:hypothetical protein
MPKLKDNQIPPYRRHRQCGQAIVTLDGSEILLGPHGTVAAEFGPLKVEAVRNAMIALGWCRG